MIVHRALIPLTAAAVLGGCMAVPTARTPQTGAVATGEPLAVVDDVKVWTTTHNEKVGEAVHKDSRGNTVGSTDVYQERTQVHTQKVWYLVQGPEQIPDEDFFRIAGDDQALQATLEMRATAKKQARRGHIAMGVGAVGVIASFFIDQPLARTVLGLGGGLAISGGWYFSYSASKMMEPESHAVQRSIAERAARRYNEGLDTRTVNVGRQF
jgi:hypothetical protein